MQRVILLCLLLLAFSVPCYAAETDDAKQLLLDVKELSVRLENGMTYTQFNEVFNSLYAKQKKFEDAYPDSDKKYDFIKIMNTYNDARQLWYALEGKDKFNRTLTVEKFKPELEGKYPDIGQKVEKNGLRWDADSTLKALFQYAKEYQKPLEV